MIREALEKTDKGVWRIAGEIGQEVI